MVLVLWVGLIVSVLAFAIDGVLWSFVFNKGMEPFIPEHKESPRERMAGLMLRQFANALLFGLAFTYFFRLVAPSLPAGVLGGLAFGLLLWLPTAAHQTLANLNWYGKIKPVAVANAWTHLAKSLVCGIVVSLLVH